jgi:hypothetical protein
MREDLARLLFTDFLFTVSSVLIFSGIRWHPFQKLELLNLVAEIEHPHPSVY